MKERLGKFLKYGILSAFALTTIYPFLWVLFSSFKDNKEIYERPFSLPITWRFENYKMAWVNAKISSNFLNSIVVSFAAVAIIIVVSAMASYILARISPSPALYTYFIIGIMIPVHAMLIPTFILMKGIGLFNTRLSLIIIYFVSNLAMSIFILVGFMKGIPKEMEESAYIDGCSRTMTFFRIIFPLSKAGLATIGTLAFLNCWNDFIFAFILITKPTLKTLTQGIMDLKGLYVTEYGPLNAGLLICIVPVFIIYMFFQNQVIKGMTAGAVKG